MSIRTGPAVYRLSSSGVKWGRNVQILCKENVDRGFKQKIRKFEVITVLC